MYFRQCPTDPREGFQLTPCYGVHRLYEWVGFDQVILGAEASERIQYTCRKLKGHGGGGARGGGAGRVLLRRQKSRR